MAFPAILPKVAARWLLTFYRAARKLRRHAFNLYYNRNDAKASSSVSLSQQQAGVSSYSAIPAGAASAVVVCDMHGALLRSPDMFPYFMLVAFEGGGLLRALLLLCVFPLVWALGKRPAGVRVMAFVAFAGLRTRDADLVARAVLPKHYADALDAAVYDRLRRRGRKVVVVTGAPRVMSEWFLKEYLGADAVIGCELQVVALGSGRYFTGLLTGRPAPLAPELTHMALTEAPFGAAEPLGATADDVVAVVRSSDTLHHLCTPGYSKEVCVQSTESAKLPRDKYPKPVIFHDGRLALLPTPAAMLAFFLFLPLGVILSVIRISIGILFPYDINFALGAIFGVRFRTSGLVRAPAAGRRKNVLYVCTHRTLADPIMLTAALRRPVAAVTYSLSRLSEAIAPIRTVRLTRDRARDAETMSRMLRRGDLAVCPEGTTCREPYLLRFSPLFAELADDVEPVALDARVTALYGTTASGLKWLDPVAFFANPAPSYRVEFLGPVPREWTRTGGRTGAEVANWVQRRLGEALGFECTGLTRRDKYMMLAGNDGVVANAK